jgi:uncharacterized membrane protein
MAVENITDINIVTNLITEIGKIGKLIQALGLVIILWLIFQIISLINNRIRRKKLNSIEEQLNRIEKKLKKIYKKSH